MKGVYIIFIALLLWNCTNTSTTMQQYDGPLKDFFIYYNTLTKEKHKIFELESAYFSILGKGDQEKIDAYLKDFEKTHNSILTDIRKKYPEKSIQLDFDQKDKTKTNVKNIYISSYQFPWNTATRLSYNIGFECDKQEDSLLSMVRFEFIDMDGDIIMTANVPVNQNGTYQFEIRPEIEFYKFNKVNITTL